jgi:hypothetical protein
MRTLKAPRAIVVKVNIPALGQRLTLRPDPR